MFGNFFKHEERKFNFYLDMITMNLVENHNNNHINIYLSIILICNIL